MSGGGTASRGRRSRPHDEEEHENHERWLVTYADMLTLLFVLFVVLYAISAVNTSKFNELKSGLASAFKNGTPSVLTQGSGIVGGESVSNQSQIGVNPPSSAGIPSTAATAASKAQAQREVEEFSKIKKAINDSLAKKGLANDALFKVDERGLTVSVMTNDLIFGGNSDILQPEGQVIMDLVARPLRNIDNNIEVDGHTNQLKVSTAPFANGWALSSARAVAVLTYLTSHEGITDDRLRATGFADTRPLISPSNPLSVARNRRVDIVVLTKLSAAAAAALPSTGSAITDNAASG
ncbi:OmpA family protein [Jatrophihabitans telluris]|uniref:OmpA family protein n=1 Tax=Jatrophihabitans telluris TaxID=2038343 RepID=A0ABY4QYN5_9ACTN|nr:flagellar motor protein MotB [Jatrophihabitans telluris]UQX87961.1 OmpA family protein [Jatrophihabitans telluris]